jgi:hypothetical protein
VALARATGTDPCATEAQAARRVQPDAEAVPIHDRLQPVFEAAFSANAPICQALGS